MTSFTSVFTRFLPIIFVFLWATGFPAAKYGTFDADPFFFLLIRFCLATMIISAIVLIFVRPKTWDWNQVLISMVVGVFIQGLYLGGVFYAVSKGMPAGICALVVALQPFLTAIFAMLILKEKLSWTRAFFFLGALFGIVLVLFPTLEISNAIPGVTVLTLGATLVSPIAISFGTVLQKRFISSLNLWVGTASQFIGAAGLMIILSALFEDQNLVWTKSTVYALMWLVLVLSVAAVGLLMYLIRRGDTTSLAGMFYLVPVVALAMTWVLFDESMNATQIFASLIVVACVGLANKYG